MHKEPAFRDEDTIIWVTSILLACVLGAVAAYTVAVAVGGSSVGTAPLREMVGLIAAGIVLIVIALQGALVRAFLASFAAVFFIALAVATHGFTLL